MCSDTCSSSASHQPECNLTRQRGSPIKLEIKNANKPFPLYEAVALLRCMALKATDPDKYKSILQLESHKEERIRTGRYLKITKKIEGCKRPVLVDPSHSTSDPLPVHFRFTSGLLGSNR